MNEPEILIVGAGPTGLILANELLRRGIAIRQVDKRPTPSGSTRAFTIHSRTMEMFHHMGAAARMEKLRTICPGNLFHFKGIDVPDNEVPALDFRKLGNTRYNYYGKINQNDLEQALRDHLAQQHGHVPEWNVECIGVEQSDSGITARLIHYGDEAYEEYAHVPWLAGADGVRSTVRQSLGIKFDDAESFVTSMSMSDVVLHGYKGDDAWVNYYTSDKGFTLVTSLPGGVHRIYLTGEFEERLKQADDPRAAYQYALDFYNTGAKIDELRWTSTWPIHKIIGETYKSGHILLCGDATHVHSPSGGQGMNACLQDAFNLGWKLALVLRQMAPETILDSYEAERRPIAEQVTEGASRIHQIVINHDIPVEERFKLTQDPDWHRQGIRWISGLAHTYRDVVRVPDGLDLPPAPFAPGDRAPDAVLSEVEPKRRLYDLLAHPRFTLLMLPSDSAAEIDACTALADRIEKRFPGHVKPLLITGAPVDAFDYDHAFTDETGQIAEAYGNDGEGRAILIRPDLAVAIITRLSDGGKITEVLSDWLTPAG